MTLSLGKAFPFEMALGTYILGLLGQSGQSLSSRHLGTSQHCPYGICYLGHYVNSGAASYLYPQKAARSEHLSAYCVRLTLRY